MTRIGESKQTSLWPEYKTEYANYRSKFNFLAHTTNFLSLELMKCWWLDKILNLFKRLYVGCSVNSRDGIKRAENNGVRQQLICNRTEFFPSTNKIAKFGKIFIKFAIRKMFGA